MASPSSRPPSRPRCSWSPSFSLPPSPHPAQFPKLARNFFQLLNAATRSYPFAIPKLPEFLFSTIWTALAESLNVCDTDPLVLRFALEAVVHLIEPSLALRLGSPPSPLPRLTPAEKKDFFTPEHAEVLTQAVPRILGNIVASSWVLFDTLHSLAADAFLACVLLNPSLTQQWALSLVDSLDPAVRQPIGEGFERLFRSINASDPNAFTRPARAAFVPSFDSFIGVSQGFLRKV